MIVPLRGTIIRNSAMSEPCGKLVEFTASQPCLIESIDELKNEFDELKNEFDTYATFFKN
jgi:hypothetical protein